MFVLGKPSLVDLRSEVEQLLNVSDRGLNLSQADDEAGLALDVRRKDAVLEETVQSAHTGVQASSSKS